MVMKNYAILKDPVTMPKRRAAKDSIANAEELEILLSNNSVEESSSASLVPTSHQESAMASYLVDSKEVTIKGVEANIASPVEDSSLANLTPIRAKPQNKWKSYIWDTFDKSPEERRLLFKLDAAVLTFATLGYFIKYLDQINVNNAFVSGMKEDLGLFKNQLNYMQTCWTVGYVIGQVPCEFPLFLHFPVLYNYSGHVHTLTIC